MRTIIQYMIEKETGVVYSRVGSEVAVPVLDWDNMKPENNFKTNYNLEKFNVFDIGPFCQYIKTKKIPTKLKNVHRAFWGMKPIR